MPSSYSPVAPAAAAPSIAPQGVPAAARAVLDALGQMRGCAVHVALPDGSSVALGEANAPAVHLRVRDYRFARRLVFGGDIGLAEGFINGEWETQDLPALLTHLAQNMDRFPRLHEGGVLGRALNWLRHWLQPNTRSGSKKNILAHYDLGNRFYEAWLDPSMTYSSARYEDDVSDLEAAQLAKYRSLADRLDLQQGDHVLEVGCGWGGFAEFVARRYGVRVTALTISDEQFRYARERIARSGLQSRVEIRNQDYRDLSGRFDKVVSIEMLEAVGERFWPVYFAKLRQVLHPGGRVALQTITIRDELFEQYRLRADFIQRFVFPGGMLPSVERLRAVTASAGFEWDGVEAFGLSYARTVSEWSRRFVERWDDIRSLGFDDRFRRLWLFYLGYCEAGFRTGRTDVMHLHLVARPA